MDDNLKADRAVARAVPADREMAVITAAPADRETAGMIPGSRA